MRVSGGGVGARDRIVVAAARLLQRQGYVGTGIKQIAKDADATLADDPGAAIEACVAELAVGLRESGWTDGCPATAAALETLGTDSEIQRVRAVALASWERLVEGKLLGSGFAAGTRGSWRPR